MLVLRAVNSHPPSTISRNVESGSTHETWLKCLWNLPTYRWTLSWGRSWSHLGLAGRSAARKSWRTSALLASWWGRQLWTQTQWVTHWNSPLLIHNVWGVTAMMLWFWLWQMCYHPPQEFRSSFTCSAQPCRFTVQTHAGKWHGCAEQWIWLQP